MPQSNLLTISLVQMDCELGAPAVNFAHAEALIAQAARAGRDRSQHRLVVLPELWTTAYDLENSATHATAVAQHAGGSGWFGQFAELARNHDIWLTGSLLEAGAGGQYYNCMALYSPEGELAGLYRKIHLFRLMQEDVYLGAGDSPALLNLPWGQTGLAICYDLRFPELFRSYALQGAKLIIVPAEWPHPRREHWRTLLRARAIENQCFVAGCNRIGSSKETGFFGSSSVIDPWGEVLGEAGETEMVMNVTIDLDLVDDVRQRIPIFADRRPELYQVEREANI